MKETDLLKFPEVRIVEASAGSGKTRALAKRYLRLIINKDSRPEHIRNILAITFTRQAAREMKERILGFLKAAALGRPSNNGGNYILDDLPVSEETARQKATELIDYIIRHYNYFQVQTIDSFINMILSGCSYRLKLSARFQIKDDYSDYLSYSLDRCIDAANSNPNIRKSFDEFLRQYLYLENKSGWLPKKNILDIMNSLFYHSTIYRGSFKKSSLTYEELSKEKFWILSMVKDLREQAPEGANKQLLKTLDKFIFGNERSFDVKEFADSKNLMKAEFSLNKGYELPGKVKELWMRIQDAVIDVARKEAFWLFNSYIDIYEHVYGIFRECAGKDDALFLSELNSQARALIAENDLTVPELYLRLANRFRHYLMDEFQDTSALRWQNLSEMITDGLSSGGSLFCVGDKKQAIFRFSGGNSELFNDVKNELGAFNVISNTLRMNYRSRKELVEFNNEIFSQSNLEKFLADLQPQNEDDIKSLRVKDIEDVISVFRDAGQEYQKGKSGGYIKVESFEYTIKEDRDEKARQKVISLIDRLKERHSLRDISVLCRWNAEVEKVSAWLIENGIAVESEKTLNLKNNKFLNEVVSFLGFLSSPIDNLAFASFILGDIFLGAAGIRKEELEHFLFSLREKYGRNVGYYIYREFRREYPSAWEEYIEGFFRSVGFVSLYELVVEIFRKFKVYDGFGEYQGYFMHFLEFIKNNEDEYQGVSDFLEYFDRVDDDTLYVDSSGAEAVKVMSIHKAKGLQFNVVVMPFLDVELKDLSSRNRKGKTSYAVCPKKDEITLLRLDSKYAVLSAAVREVYKEEYKKAFIDELNIIYVAFTRAIDEFYVFVPVRKAGGRNIVEYLIPGNLFERGEILVNRDTKKDEAFPLQRYIPLSMYSNWKGIIKDEFADLRKLRGRRSLNDGSIIHHMLSSIGDLTGKVKETELAKAKAKALRFFPGIEDFKDYELLIRRLIENREAERFFFVEDGVIHNEREIVDSSGKTFRIDRLIVKSTEAWVVDYKTKGEFVEDYEKQLRDYAWLVRGIYPEKRVRAFVVFLEGPRIEEIV